MGRRHFTLLVYKLPPQPTRLRIQVWRKLQAVGAVYLQDGVAALPSRADLDENLKYVATSIQEMGGSALVLKATGMESWDSELLVERFRKAADARMLEMLKSIGAIDAAFPESHSFESLAKVDEAVKRERIAYLKARRLNYFECDMEAQV